MFFIETELNEGSSCTFSLKPWKSYPCTFPTRVFPSEKEAIRMFCEVTHRDRHCDLFSTILKEGSNLRASVIIRSELSWSTFMDSSFTKDESL